MQRELIVSYDYYIPTFSICQAPKLDKIRERGYNGNMKRNFELLMQEQLKNIEKGTRLLLHSCCAPCSSTCLERLKEYFQVTVLYYNPNIDEREEYEKRKAEQIRFLKETGWADFHLSASITS